jgi:hypothetical protein
LFVLSNADTFVFLPPTNTRTRPPVISAVVILTAQGVPCRGALVRDVCAMLITVVTVWTQLSRGSIGSDSISLFFALYVGFVLLVLAADIYHRAVVIPRLAHNAALAELERQETAGTDVVAKKNRFDTMLTALSNYDNVTMTDADAIESDDLAMDRPIQLHGHNGYYPGPTTMSTHPATADHRPTATTTIPSIRTVFCKTKKVFRVWSVRDNYPRAGSRLCKNRATKLLRTPIRVRVFVCVCVSAIDGVDFLLAVSNCLLSPNIRYLLLIHFCDAKK